MELFGFIFSVLAKTLVVHVAIVAISMLVCVISVSPEFEFWPSIVAIFVKLLDLFPDFLWKSTIVYLHVKHFILSLSLESFSWLTHSLWAVFEIFIKVVKLSPVIIKDRGAGRGSHCGNC